MKTLLFLLCLFTGFLPVNANVPPVKCVVLSEFIYQPADVDFPSCHASTLVETKKGILAAWFGGTEEKNPDVCIYMSSKSGNRWGKPVKVADGKHEGKQYPCWNPVLFKRNNGDIILFYKVGPDPRTWWGMYKISKDVGKTWTAGIKLPEGFLGPIKNKPVDLSDGTILYPTSFETPSVWNSYLEISDQSLMKWEKIVLDNGGYQTIQPTILKHGNGAVQLLFRSRNKKIDESWSSANGRTWSPIQPTDLPNNNSGIDAVSLKEGGHLLVYNPITEGRNRLALGFSRNGKSWNLVTLLEDEKQRAEFSYPAIIQTNDGMVHITYTWKRELVKHVVVDPSKIDNSDENLLTGEMNGNFRSVSIFPYQQKHVHSSSLVELPNGDLLSCWFEGSGERSSNDVMIRGARKKQGEVTWSEPFLMADSPDHPDCNPFLFLDRNKRLHLCWVVVNANRWEASILKTRISADYENSGAPVWNWQDIILLKPGNDFAGIIEKKFRESKIPDLSWAGYAPLYEKMIVEAANDPVKRDIGWMGRIIPTVLPSGRILMPLYNDGFNLSLVAISDDQGDTWKASTPIVGKGNIQPAIVRKRDGTLIAYMRDNGDAPGRIQVSTSSDDGYEWSASVKSEIPNPGASVAAISLKSGNWLLVYNDLEEGRYRLAVSLSGDEGKSWRFTRYLENDETRQGGFSYPNAIQSTDETIHLTYSYSKDNQKTIKHVAFRESWLTSGKGE